jgi:hypothetical protein
MNSGPIKQMINTMTLKGSKRFELFNPFVEISGESDFHSETDFMIDQMTCEGATEMVLTEP